MRPVANHQAERARDVRNREAWAEVLDRLEHDVAATEELLGSGEPLTARRDPAPWQAPQLDGPLPEELLARAHDIHRRQTAARAAPARALADSRSQQEAVRRPARPREAAAPPAYVDVSA
jgi:hypothetical protein